jgi:ribosomal protein L17
MHTGVRREPMKLKLSPFSLHKRYFPLFILALFLAVGKLPAQGENTGLHGAYKLRPLLRQTAPPAGEINSPAQRTQFEDMALSTQETQSEEIQNKTEELINWLDEGEFAKVQQVLHPDLQPNWTSERIEQRWKELLAQTGSLQRIVDSRAVRTINSDIVIVTLEFENGTNEMLIDFNKQGQIVGVDFPQTQTIEEIAEKFVDDLASQDFAGARSYLHPFLKEEMFPAQIQQKWEQFLEQTGQFRRIVKTQARTVSDVDNINLVLVTVEFANVTDDLIVAFDRDKKIINVDVIDVGSQ